jgi:pimeloyl-ACP methyl ester carboxylesterase
MCIAGADDATAPPAAVSRLADLIEGARYVELDGVGHLMNLEAPDRFNRLMLDLAAQA